MPAPRIIKRYANRKLYDTEQSRYITLQQIANLVQSGVDVQIIDNKTREDLTGVTLAQILLKAEKRNERALPLSTLTEMLRTSGTRIQKSLEQQVSVIREEAGRTVEGIRNETGRQIKDLKDRTNFDDVRNQLKDFVNVAQTNLEEIQARVEDRIREASEEGARYNANETAKESDSQTESNTTSSAETEPHLNLRLDTIEQRLLNLERLIANLASTHDIQDDEPTR